MIIVYYRDADGKIVRAHTAPEDWTMETAQERIDQFNSEQGNKATAYALQAEDGASKPTCTRKRRNGQSGTRMPCKKQ